MLSSSENGAEPSFLMRRADLPSSSEKLAMTKAKEDLKNATAMIQRGKMEA